MAENNNKCNGNCMSCNPLQRQFCASQLAFTNMKQIEVLSKEVKNLCEKIEAMQNNEATIFDPMASGGDIVSQQYTIKAQEGDGVIE